MNPISFLFSIFFLNLIIDFSSSPTRRCLSHPCKAKHVIPLLVFHHLLSTFLLFGWLIPDRRVLILFLIANACMLLEWWVFGYCRLTRLLNQVCGQTLSLPFRDIFWYTGLKNVTLFRTLSGGKISVFVVYAIVSFFLGVYHLMRLNRNHK